MKANILENIRARFLTALQSIDNFLNKEPEQKKPVGKLDTKTETPHKQVYSKNQKQGNKKEIYGHKGSGYKGKGNVNTDAATFNHPRKEEPHGKVH